MKCKNLIFSIGEKEKCKIYNIACSGNSAILICGSFMDPILVISKCT
jgi:hypothetical protein